MKLIGRILKPHGIKGEVKVLLINERIRMWGEKSVVIGRRGREERNFVIEGIISEENHPVLKFKGVSDRNQALLLKGFELYFPEEDSIIGYGLWHRGERIGKVKKIMEIPMNYVLIIEKKNGEEFLLPFALCSVQEGKIIAEIPEGIEEI